MSALSRRAVALGRDNIHILPPPPHSPPMVGMEGLIEKTWPGGHTLNKSRIVL